MSAIADTADGPVEIIKVLFALFPGYDTLDVAGPLEVLSRSLHNPKDKTTKAFECQFVGPSAAMTSTHGLTVKADMDYEDANDEIEDFDVIIVPGGEGVQDVLKNKTEPLNLLKAFVEIQEKNPAKERTILAICTGSLLLAQQGLLEGLAATTHPDYYTRLETICQDAATRDLSMRTDVMEERYVVNNARFDLGDNPDENPYIIRKQPEGGVNTMHARRKSIARKGSNAWRESRRRESIIRRASMPCGGMRIITTGGVTAGLDASLYLVGSLVSHDSALEVAHKMQYTWVKGVTVDAIDV
ncbi:class I glutamine amidotransferase-like protein [Lindgomyces ingoldianus]|uniref:Class I glutamine amidotransferase-like protein n=1 Tax=Lindgomyces ingoldianus TaxID=673940 RepID=A0ACB6RE68_9PLEO|nr:class I glutamine amidotransferase-like protein [Lindgomyces ingoldianus]KAF2476615.1 class I glutamine amidotransferase-like protein [Lindgomyces ingoldianus]